MPKNPKCLIFHIIIVQVVFGSLNITTTSDSTPSTEYTTTDSENQQKETTKFTTEITTVSASTTVTDKTSTTGSFSSDYTLYQATTPYGALSNRK